MNKKKNKKIPKNQNTQTRFLSKGFTTDYCACGLNAKLGTLTITANLITKASFGGTVTELYRAVSDTNEPLYVKTSLHSKYAMPYVMNPVGEFKKNGIRYYVFKAYDGNLSDLFDTRTELGQCWNNQWTAKQKECFAARVLLMLLLTLRECYARRLSNLDIKPQNILYRIIDREKAEVEIRIIDIAESVTVGEYTISNDVRLNEKGSVLWVAPALLRLFGNRDEEAATSDGSKRAAEFADIYSIGVIFLFLYTGKTLWKNRNVSHSEASSKMLNTSYRNYYFDEKAADEFASCSDDLNSYTTGELTFAKKPAGVASLMCDMLSFPDIENSGVTREKWLDAIITSYCGILTASGRLPDDMILPARYLEHHPDQEITTVLIRLTVKMSDFNEDKGGWEILNQWNEYRCVRIAADSTVNVPFTIYHMYPLTDYAYRQMASDSLYLINDRGIIRYVFYPKGDAGTDKSERTRSGEFRIGQRIEDETTDSQNGKRAKLQLSFERIRCKE